MRVGVRPLEPFPDPRSLLDYMRGDRGKPKAKNDVLKALLACRSDDHDVVDIILALALWPGLDRVYIQLCRGFPGNPEAVAGELIGAFAAACRKADLARINKVAATLTMNARRDATSTLCANKSFARDLDPEIDRHAGPDDVCNGDAEAGFIDRDDLWLQEQLVRDYGQDGALLYYVAVEGQTQKEASERLGLTHDATRKRHARTVQRIRKEPPDYLRPRVPVRAPDWHLSVEEAGKAGAATDDDDDNARGGARSASGAVPALGAAGSAQDRRRIQDRGGRGNDRRRNARRDLPPRR